MLDISLTDQGIPRSIALNYQHDRNDKLTITHLSYTLKIVRRSDISIPAIQQRAL